MPFVCYAIRAFLVILGLPFVCHANQQVVPVCEIVDSGQLAALYASKLYPSQQENGCRWSVTPDGKAFFQIGVIESHKNLRQFFEKKIPLDYRLKKITDLGDRGLFTESGGYFSVIAIRDGNWVLISTVDLLYIKPGDTRQTVLWDIYRNVLKNLR